MNCTTIFSTLLISLILSLPCTFPAAGAAPPDAVKAFLTSRYGKDLREVTPARDSLILRYLKGFDIYYVNVWNPMTVIAGRPLFHYTLVMGKDGRKTLFQDVYSPALFLQEACTGTITEKTALERAKLYALLCRARIVNSAGELGGSGSAGEKAIASPAVKEKNGTFIITFYGVTDPGIRSVSKFTLSLDRTGKMKVLSVDHCSSRGGYD